MANVNLIPKDLTQAPDLAVNEAKSGEHYDSCPCCHKEAEPVFKNRQGDGGSEIFDWSLYNCDGREGGCGYSWDRTTEQGAARNAARGMNTKRLTSGAQKLVTMPGLSRSYQRGFDQIDWSKGKPNLAFPEMNEGRRLNGE